MKNLKFNPFSSVRSVRRVSFLFMNSLLLTNT